MASGCTPITAYASIQTAVTAVSRDSNNWTCTTGIKFLSGVQLVGADLDLDLESTGVKLSAGSARFYVSAGSAF